MENMVEAASQIDTETGSFPVVNQSGVSDAVLTGDGTMRELASALSRWVDNARAAGGRTTMFDRGAYIPPNNPYDEMRAARHATRYDSVVSGVAEITEAYAFQGVKWESQDPDEADVFNQLSKNMNLDAVVRKMWREEFMYGQFVCAKLWGEQTFTVRGKSTNGNKRKKTYKVWAPLQLRILDSCKVVPIGVGPLGGEGLAWQATPGEIGDYTSAYMGDLIDPLMTTFFQGLYQPTFEEAGELGHLGVNIARLLIMNPEWVFRHTLTKPDYERFPDVRMKSVFSLLDLKQQLILSDRAALIGAANYILLIRKGDKDTPGTPEEIKHLQENYNFIAKMPVIITDHRLTIDIIAPKTDFTLDSKKYDVIDQRIKERLLGVISHGSGGREGSSGGAAQSTSLAVAKLMENRRHMLKRTIELEVARAIVEHPRNKGIFEAEPSLVYMPRNIALSMDNGYAQALISLRTQREISRETILEFFGLDESTEAMRMQIEADMYDEIFKTEVPYTGGSPGEGVDPSLDKKGATDSGAMQIQVGPDGTLTAKPTAPDSAKPGAAKPAAKGKPNAPVSTPNDTPESPKASGARGGRPLGGGQPKKSPAAIAKPRGSGGNTSTKAQEGDNDE